MGLLAPRGRGSVSQGPCALAWGLAIFLVPLMVSILVLGLSVGLVLKLRACLGGGGAFAVLLSGVPVTLDDSFPP